MSSVEYRDFQDFILLLSTFLCTSCFGMVLIFSIVIMPGLSHLDDGLYLQVFQAIDGIIQKGQPLFGLFWLGSIVLLLTLAVGMIILTTTKDDYDDKRDITRLILVLVATGAYLIGQFTTFTINIPLNNRVQTLEDLESMDGPTQRLERDNFELRWNGANRIRTILFGISSLLLQFTLLLHEPPSWF